jgi:hypothetical protein
MKALTVWQPWATLIAIGAKPYEFRGWKPPKSMIGQRLAIHAGARPIRRVEVLELLNQCKHPEHYGRPSFHVERALPVLRACYDGTAALPLSHIVCTVTLGEPKRGDLCAVEFGEDAANDSNRDGTFNWGWPMLEVAELQPPVSARGAQGFWDWRA